MNLWIIALFPPLKVTYLLIICYDILMLCGAVVAFQIFPEIQLEDNGIRLITPVRTQRLDYDDIVNLIEIYQMFASNRLRVDMNKLSLVHRIIGFTFGAPGKASFLLRKDISDYGLLLKTLISKTGIEPKKVII